MQNCGDFKNISGLYYETLGENFFEYKKEHRKNACLGI